MSQPFSHTASPRRPSRTLGDPRRHPGTPGLGDQRLDRRAGRRRLHRRHDPACRRLRAGVAVVPIVVGALVLTSLIIVQPGHTKVVRFFGSYVGTVRRTGLWWIVPLADRRSLSIRVRNFETNHLKVNDADGNPVEIAAIVVWQVADTARAVYAVDDYVNFVEVQAESALRHVATTHPYDDPAARAPRCAARSMSSPVSSPRRSPSV